MKTKHRLIVRVISGGQLVTGQAPINNPGTEAAADWRAEDRTGLEARRFQLTGSKTKDAAFYLLTPFSGLPR